MCEATANKCHLSAAATTGVLDQSAARYIRLDLSKMQAPSSISLMIIDLDVSNS